MIIKKADNLYRSVGGRPNLGGVERINRDGKMEVLHPGEEEITPKQRMKWNAKAKLDPRGRLPHEIYDVQEDDAGNPMRVDDETRTRLPRPHQFSMEARLSEERGEKAKFHKSTATSAQAHGVPDGTIADNTFVDPGKKEKDEKKTKKLAKGSSEYKVADTFRVVSEALSTRDFLDSKTVAEISKETNVSVEDILILEKVAKSNGELAKKYVDVKCVPCQKNIPGNIPTEDDTIEKESDEEEKRHMQQVAYDTGLCEVEPK